jgi:hypothetical protein
MSQHNITLHNMINPLTSCKYPLLHFSLGPSNLKALCFDITLLGPSKPFPCFALSLSNCLQVTSCWTPTYSIFILIFFVISIIHNHDWDCYGIWPLFFCVEPCMSFDMTYVLYFVSRSTLDKLISPLILLSFNPPKPTRD